ncbi:hypothetical protein [Domibacillus tundrae]|uniref:hypothetical protein n=1 Tax=Domibacillus tundrae TaxID=1587527 RepID=UPI00155ACD74|nr:hypothetical protein [Domibacillus tundrae]
MRQISANVIESGGYRAAAFMQDRVYRRGPSAGSSGYTQLPTPVRTNIHRRIQSYQRLNMRLA